jgi:glyoxylase-like metal-dependent hydrolase (beta-lactamase superfamily II)
MAKWTILPLDFGTNILDKAVATYLTDCGTPLTIHSIGFLLKEVDGTGMVLVDTGFKGAEECNRVVKEDLQRTPRQEPKAVFEELDIDLERIRTIILTHLHFDHCGNLGMFQHADVYVQRTELRYAYAPLPGEELPYFSPLIGEEPPYLGASLRVIHGDMHIAEGVRVTLSPGHTPGGQMVYVDTKYGTGCITGDNAFLFENIERNIPSGHIYSREDWFQSMDLARRAADFFIPSHDPQVLSAPWEQAAS